MKFSEYVEMWKRDCRVKHGDSWKGTQDTLLRLHILPILGNMSIYSIEPPHISRVIMASKAKGHSDKTTAHIYTIMYSIFQNVIEFYEDKKLERNPVKRKFHKPTVPKKKAAFMIPDETTWFLEYVMGTRYAVGIWIQALTAMRVSEMLPLKWKDFDFVNNQITMSRVFIRANKANGGNRIQEYPKNKEQMYVPIPLRLRKFLLPRVGKPDDFVMPNENGDMICYYVYRRFMRTTCDRFKIKIRSSHGLRHSCTEIWVNAGGTTEDIRRLLNHKSLDATAGYIHRTDDRLHALGKLIDTPKRKRGKSTPRREMTGAEMELDALVRAGLKKPQRKKAG